MAKTRIRTSVIIPAYNAEKHIENCLRAVEAQTSQPLEIIVIDDGSKDNTRTIVKTFPDVKFFSQQNQGPAKARNVGAQKAKGEIIVFLDSDCVPEKNWLEEMLKPFSDEKVIGVQGAYKTNQTAVVAQFDQMDIEYRYERMKRAKKLDWIGSYSAAYHKKEFEKFKGFDESFPKASGEDAELSYRIAEAGGKLVFNPHAIVFHTHPATLWKYLNVKFFRAYWRMRMYVKHPQKAVTDSYTPQELKVGIPTGIAIGLISMASVIVYGIELVQLAVSPTIGGAMVVISGAMLGLLFGGMIILVLSPALLHQLHGKKWTLKLAAPFILCLRAIAFGLGMFFGLIDPRVRK